MTYFWEEKVNQSLSLLGGLKLLGHMHVLKSYLENLAQELIIHARSKKSVTSSSEPTK